MCRNAAGNMNRNPNPEVRLQKLPASLSGCSRHASKILALPLAVGTDSWQGRLAPYLPRDVITQWSFFHWMCDLLLTPAGNLRGQRAGASSSSSSSYDAHLLLPSSQLFQELRYRAAVKPDLEGGLSPANHFSTSLSRGQSRHY